MRPHGAFLASRNGRVYCGNQGDGGIVRAVTFGRGRSIDRIPSEDTRHVPFNQRGRRNLSV
jgi:hypothetical protein